MRRDFLSWAKSVRPSKLALLRSRTEEVHTWNKQNRFETLTHRSPIYSGCWCQPSSRRKVSVDKTCFCFDTCLRARLRSVFEFNGNAGVNNETEDPVCTHHCLWNILGNPLNSCAHLLSQQQTLRISFERRKRQEASPWNFSLSVYANCTEMKVLIAADLGKYGIF